MEVLSFLRSFYTGFHVFRVCFSENQEKTEDQYEENSHLNAVPHWISSNTLGPSGDLFLKALVLALQAPQVAFFLWWLHMDIARLSSCTMADPREMCKE